MKILIVKTSAIGDVIHTLPSLTCLRHKYPDARIDWLVEEAASEAVIGHSAVNTVLVSRRKEWIRLCGQRKYLAAWHGFIGFVRQLRSTEYDLLIDFQGLLKSGMFVFLARAKRKVGFGRGMDHAEGSWLFLNERIPPVDMNQHALTRELMLLDALGIPCKEVVFDFPIKDCHRERAKALLKESGVDLQQPMVAINPMTTWPTKHWTSQSFVSLAETLASRGITVVFTGGQGDRDAVQKGILCRMRPGGAINLAGKTDLKILAAIYSMSRLVISTDTGPMHLAAAVQTPVVALFGPTAPWRTGPYGAGHQVIRRDLPCSPCFKKVCPMGTTACMNLILPQTVWSAVAMQMGLSDN